MQPKHPEMLQLEKGTFLAPKSHCRSEVGPHSGYLIREYLFSRRVLRETETYSMK